MHNPRIYVYAILLILLTAGCVKYNGYLLPPDEFTLSISTSPAEGGTVTPSSGTYDMDAQITIVAIPSQGYYFKEWTGSVQSTVDQASITMNSSKRIVGVFEKLDKDGDGVDDIVDSCPDTPLGVAVDGSGCPNPVYLASNGVTIKCYEWANISDTGKVDGVVYTIVDEILLRQMVNSGDDLTKICTTKVTNMNDLFRYQGTSFNQDITTWDVSNVTSMKGLFWNESNSRSQFNQPIGIWDVSQVKDMGFMFSGTSFNQDLSDWNVGNVNIMNGMFSKSDFNQAIGGWDVGNVTDMSYMFWLSQFDQPLNNWDVSSVTFMDNMFLQSKFNQPIENWDVSNVAEMNEMFYGAVFDQPLGNWDVSNVNTMVLMFYKAKFFNQDLSNWNTTNVTYCTGFNDITPQWKLPKPTFLNCVTN